MPRCGSRIFVRGEREIFCWHPAAESWSRRKLQPQKFGVREGRPPPAPRLVPHLVPVCGADWTTHVLWPVRAGSSAVYVYHLQDKTPLITLICRMWQKPLNCMTSLTWSSLWIFCVGFLWTMPHTSQFMLFSSFEQQTLQTLVYIM